MSSIFLLSPDNNPSTVFFDCYAKNEQEIEDLLDKFLYHTQLVHEVKDVQFDAQRLELSFKGRHAHEEWDDSDTSQFFIYKVVEIEHLPELDNYYEHDDEDS